MSDEETGPKKSGYRLEIASSSRAKCKGPKPCNGTPIQKGTLRMGSVVDFRGATSFAWRHWGCVTTRIIENMKKSFDSAAELDGFDELPDEDQARVEKAWEDGHVADEDIPESARKQEDDEVDSDDAKKTKSKAKTTKKRSKKDINEEADADGNQEEEEERPKKTKRAKKNDADADKDSGTKAKRPRKVVKDKESSEASKAKPKKKRAAKKAPSDEGSPDDDDA